MGKRRQQRTAEHQNNRRNWEKTSLEIEKSPPEGSGKTQKSKGAFQERRESLAEKVGAASKRGGRG